MRQRRDRKAAGYRRMGGHRTEMASGSAFHSRYLSPSLILASSGRRATDIPTCPPLGPRTRGGTSPPATDAAARTAQHPPFGLTDLLFRRCIPQALGSRRVASLAHSPHFDVHRPPPLHTILDSTGVYWYLALYPFWVRYIYVTLVFLCAYKT